jgi:hypothetical protein
MRDRRVLYEIDEEKHGGQRQVLPEVRSGWRCPTCCWLLGEERDVLVADGVVYSPVDEVLVDGLGDHVVLVAVRAEQAVGVGREPGRAGGPADGQVAQPQLV